MHTHAQIYTFKAHQTYYFEQQQRQTCNLINPEQWTTRQAEERQAAKD